MEHLPVPSVVLEGEAQIESVVTELPDHTVLEGPCGAVIIGTAHDEQVPSQSVPGQPSPCLVVHRPWPSREQQDPQITIETFEQSSNLGDGLIVTAGREERLPVPSGTVEIVLTARRVGKHTVHVEHDCW